jgi:hypothetical protein
VNGAGFDLAGNLPVHFDLELSYLGEFQFAIFNPEAWFLWIGYTVISAMAFETGIARLGA